MALHYNAEMSCWYFQDPNDFPGKLYDLSDRGYKQLVDDLFARNSTGAAELPAT
ncbi:MAG: hypothetical protein P1U34_12615 [Coxiellaceae bacterium]|nr:hypothetical protein [Coxiellaceae bacterium]